MSEFSFLQVPAIEIIKMAIMRFLLLRLNSQDIGSTAALQGSLVVMILPQSKSSLSFSWDTVLAENLSRNDSVTIAGYMEVPQGRLTWTPNRR